jgi:hypothetical protein
MWLSRGALAVAVLNIVAAITFNTIRAAGAESGVRAAAAEAELQREGLLRGRPGGDIAGKSPITKADLALLVDNVLERLRAARAQAVPSPAATRPSVPPWLLRLKTVPPADALAGYGWSNARSTISRQDAIAYILRTSLTAVPKPEGNPPVRIPRVADDDQIAPDLKPIIYVGLVRNLVHVDRKNRVRPRDPELREDAIVMERDILRSGASRI